MTRDRDGRPDAFPERVLTPAMCGGYSELSTVSSIHRVLRTLEEAVMILDQHQGAARTRFGRATTLGPIALLAWLALMPAAAHAQATIAGTVRDTSGAILPGVTVEATSPALIEKVRSAVTDGAGVVPHREPPARQLHRDLHPAWFCHCASRGSGTECVPDHHNQRRAQGGRRRGDHYRDR